MCDTILHVLRRSIYPAAPYMTGICSSGDRATVSGTVWRGFESLQMRKAAGRQAIVFRFCDNRRDKKLDNFREWVSDNLRYILLGLAVIVLAVALFFGIRVLTSAISDKEDKDAQKTEQDADKGDDAEATPTPEAENTLEENAHPDVNELVTKYYTALGNKDIETIRTLVDELNESDEAQITRAQFIESYTDVNVYTVNGAEEGSYIVFAEYNYKLRNIDTPAPGLSQLYVKTNADGKLFIYTQDLTADEQKMIDEAIQDESVQNLKNEVNQKVAEAKAADPMLAQVLDQLGSETNYAQQAEVGATLVARQECNVRVEPNTESEILGQLQQGDQVEKKGMTEDWIRIEYNGQTAYVRSDMFQ